MYGNKAKIICILPDNRELGYDKMRFLKMFEKFKGDNEAIIMDWLEEDTTTHFNIYMCDGNNNSYNRLKCLLHYYSCLDEIFIFIINQWNFNDVKMETKDLIKNVNLKVLYEKEIIIIILNHLLQNYKIHGGTVCCYFTKTINYSSSVSLNSCSFIICSFLRL